jgi:hypothetical protein
MNVIKTIIVIIAMMALSVGGMIYVFFRPESIMMFNWFPLLGVVHKQVNVFRTIHIPDFLVYSIPDGLWLFSYILLIGVIWNFNYHRCMFLIMLLPIYAITHEILQLYHLVPGYFDILDFVVYVVATLLGISVLVVFNYVYKFKNQVL